MRSIKILAAAMLLTQFSTGAIADPISFTFTGSGSGSLGGTSFGNSAFTISATGDTASRQDDGFSVFWIDHTSASIDIAGVGVFNFLTGTRTFANGGVVGFSRAGSSGLDLYDSGLGAVDSGWDMLSSIGSVATSFSLLQWGNSAVNTDGGVLAFNFNGGGQGGFQATVGESTSVPEPGTLALLAVALLGLALFGQRRRAIFSC